MTMLALLFGCLPAPEPSATVTGQTPAETDTGVGPTSPAETGLPTYTGTPATCQSIADQWAQSYVALVEDHRGCEDLFGCVALPGACDTDLGACYEGVNLELAPTALDDLEEAYRAALRAAGCPVPSGGCEKCYGAYVAFCQSGQCVAVYTPPGE